MSKRPGRALAVALERTPSANGAAPFVDGLTTSEVLDVPLDHVNLDDLTYQYRFGIKADNLQTTIAREGQLEPVDLLGPKPYRIIDGFRRVHAIKALGWTTVKALVHRNLDDEQAHERAFVKNVVRKNLSPIEKANAIRLAKKRGVKRDVIAAEFGLSEKQIARYEQLLELPKGLQELVDEGELSMAHAKLLADFGVTDVVEWVEKIQEKKWTAAELQREIRKGTKRRGGSGKRVFVKIDGDVLRVKSINVKKSASPGERDRVVKALQQAIRFLSS